MDLETALRHNLGDPPMLEPLDTIGAIWRVFQREPGAANYRYHSTKFTPAQSYATTRLAKEAGVTRRTAERWVTRRGAEVRLPSAEHKRQLVSAAETSRAQNQPMIARLESFKQRGMRINSITATIDIIEDDYQPRTRVAQMAGPWTRGEGSNDSRHRMFRLLDIPADDLLSNFIDAWLIGRIQEALDWFELALFNAPGFGSGYGSLSDIDELDIQGGIKHATAA